MATKYSLEDLWDTAPPGNLTFGPEPVSGLPDLVRAYLEHAITPGTALASSIRLRMHGEIKLRRWYPFHAEEVIQWQHGMVWRATVRMFGLPVMGFDGLVGSEGAMRWKLLGIIPLVAASGPDVARSAAGRVNAESVWLPSVLCNETVSWSLRGPAEITAEFAAHGIETSLHLGVNKQGRLETLALKRWGNPDDTIYRDLDFGGLVEAEDTFDGYTIPTRIRIGWHFGSDRFESEGEFFRATVDSARFRGKPEIPRIRGSVTLLAC